MKARLFTIEVNMQEDLIEIPVKFSEEQLKLLTELGLIEETVINELPEGHKGSYFEEVTYTLKLTRDEVKLLLEEGIEVV